MRSWICTATLGLLMACPKQTTTEPVGPPPPNISCPAGAIPYGAEPPHGKEAWCRLVTGGGVQKHGPYKTWHDNGTKAIEGTYLHDKQDGIWKAWFPTGDTEYEGKYVGGVKDGVWFTYYPDGQKASEGKYVDDKEHGPWKYWSEGGGTRTEGTWVLGDRDGTWMVYASDDTPLSEAKYRSGRLISKREITREDGASSGNRDARAGEEPAPEAEGDPVQGQR